jgi:hypothetical protein
VHEQPQADGHGPDDVCPGLQRLAAAQPVFVLDRLVQQHLHRPVCRGTDQLASAHHRLPEHPEIFLLSNEPQNGKPSETRNAARHWHSDLSFTARPSTGNVEAPLVFAGYGLSLPEAGVDDLAGLDVRGKIVVHVNGVPTGLSAPLQAQLPAMRSRPVQIPTGRHVPVSSARSTQASVPAQWASWCNRPCPTRGKARGPLSWLTR